MLSRPWEGLNVADLLPLLIALLAVLVSLAVYLGESRRSDFEVARTLHLDLTSGDVALAREQLGTLRYGTDAAVAALDPRSALTAYFTLLWCFERIHHGRQGLVQRKLLRFRRSTAVRFLDRALAWHLREWSDGLGLARRRLELLTGWAIDDAESRSGLAALLEGSGLRLTEPPTVPASGG